MNRLQLSALTRLKAALFSTMVSATAAFLIALQAFSQTTALGDGVETAVPRSPEDGGARRWSVEAGGSLNLYDGPSADASVIDVITDGAVLSNMGCRQGDDRIWCDVRPFRGGARGFAAAEFLKPAEGPDGIVPTGRDDSPSRARKRDFDERGEIQCAQEQGQALGECPAAIARGVGGDATVVVTFPNGFARMLYFVHGEFTSASATMSGVGTDTDWQIEGGHHIIRVDDQRYILPDTLVFGE